MITRPEARGDQRATAAPRIICMMRIRNEERWLKDVFDSIAPVAGIVVLDDGSTDSTPTICKTHPAVVNYHRLDEPLRDQTRDKMLALNMALKQRPDWILGLDGDEMLESSAAARIFEAIRACPDDVSVFKIESLFMWNDMEHYRTDGIYRHICQERMFKLAGQDAAMLHFKTTQFRENGHCTRLPTGIKGREIEIDVKILHLGYMYAEIRAQRHERYRKRDPEQFATGYYEHLLDQPHMILAEWRERPSPPASNTRKQEIKPEYYYANARRNLADLVPQTARRVLDVGCGQGLTGGLLRAERGIEVVGIEIHPQVAESARQHLSRVITGDVETMELPFPDGYFDCLLMGDVLEHLVDPWNTLQKLVRVLNPAGTVVASVPNVRNLGVVKKLLEGSWTYEEWGILDRTHLRFFALKDMLSLFEQAGLEVTVAEIVRDPLFEKEMAAPPGGATNVDTGKLLLRGVTPEELNELTAQQFIFTGKLKVAARAETSTAKPDAQPEVSIVIPVFNNLSYTRQCITSLFTVKEPVNFEVIVVDNGSTDGTAEYLKQLPPAVRIVSLGQNLGFAKGCNVGAREARGRYVCFLNNDTVVLPGWLSAMVECIRHDPDIGVVGNLQIFPGTEKVQQAGIVCGPDKMVRSIYNNELPADHPAVQKPREFQFIAGSCMLIEKEFFWRLGGFDESYHNSCEDVDLCMKAREAGRKVFYCPQSRIYHHESRTVAGHDKNSDNYRRFVARWGDKMRRDDLDYLRADGFLSEEKETAAAERNDKAVTNTSPSPRIGILTTYNQPCGLASYARSLVSALRGHGVEAVIFAEKTDAILGADEGNVVRCWTRDPAGGGELIAEVAARKIELLHINHGGMFAPDGWLCNTVAELRKAGVRIVTTFHATDAHEPMFGWLCRMSDHVFVHHSQNVVELAALGAPAACIEQIPLGMPPVDCRDIFESKLELGWDPARKIVSTFGFVEPHKGVLELIEAMKLVHEKTGAHLHVLGGPHPANRHSPAYLEECRRKARESGLGEAVHFSEGYLPDEEIARRLRASDVVVMNYMSRRYESSAAAAFALASGRPLVSSSVPTFEYPLALTFKVTEAFHLAQAIHDVLLNPFVGRVLLDNVLKYEKTARWDVVAGRVAEVYRRVLAQPPKPDTDLLKFYRTHPDEIYAEPLQRERVRWLKSKAEGRILEIGPATGYVSEFTGASAAVDINRGRLAVCEVLRPKTRFLYGNVVEGLPFGDKEFDQVHAPEILEHVDFDQAVIALRECARVGKRVLLTLPNADKPNYDPDLVHNIEHRWIVNRQSIERLLREAGVMHYEVDVSPGLDFYLLDVRSNAPASARITPRAAALRSVELDPGRPLRVAVDMSALEDPSSRDRGIGRFMLGQFGELMSLRPHWTFTAFGVHAEPEPPVVRELVAQANGGYARWSQLPGAMPDVLYLPHPMGATAHELLKAVHGSNLFVACTFYDLVPLLMAGEYLNPDPGYKAMYLSRLAQVKERCDLFLCISQTTAQDLQVHLQVPLSRLRIIHGAVTECFAAPPSDAQAESVLVQHGLANRPFLLSVGMPDQRRNPARMFAALSAARRVSGRDLSLLVTGSIPDGYCEALRRIAAQCELPESAVHFTGQIPDEELHVLYHRATALLHPSLYEGFGFPIAEAMSAGLPVIAGNNSSQAEICGDAALLVDVHSIEEIARGIVRMVNDANLRAELTEKGRMLCRRFKWRKVAEKTAMYLSEAIEHRTCRCSHTGKDTVTAPRFEKSSAAKV
jgi:glycosyltransferase involved in cell wall biosynthesis/GT2 family glycosyltransferase/predicted O-methyltransferase YrrM